MSNKFSKSLKEKEAFVTSRFNKNIFKKLGV